MHMAGVLFYEFCEANVIWAQFREPVEDTGLTGVKEGQVLGHLWVEQSGSCSKRNSDTQKVTAVHPFPPLIDR